MDAAALIGREREVSALAGMLGGGSVRLVTVTGPAGVGKTRVADAVADRLARDRSLRVVRVALGPLGDPALVADAIATAAGAAERTRARSALEAAAAALCEEPALLVLDNFEHLGPAATDVAALLEACPGIATLVTSRHVLGLTSEHMYPLAPLALPEAGENDADRAGRCASVALFVMRARLRDPSFELTAENAPAVSEICRRLDGLPLAIELVAALASVLPPPALIARWEGAVALDTRGPHDLPPRQRTLRRAFDWSYDLLEPHEQALLRRLAVFPGGFDLAAVEAACRGGSDVLPALDVEPMRALAGLVDRSLVDRDRGSTSEPRFTQLVTVRGYLRERLALHGEETEAENMMAEASAAVARQPGQFLGTSGSREALDRLERELNNLHAALGVFVRADPARAVELASDLFGFWRTRHVREGREWLERALSAGGPELPAATRARGLWPAAVLAHLQGDAAASRRFADASLAAARDAGDQLTLARALHVKGFASIVAGDADAAAYLREALALCEQLGDTFGMAAACNDLGELARGAGMHDDAAAYYERGLELWREMGDAAGVSRAGHNLAQSMIARGDLARAGELLSEALGESSGIGDGQGRAVTLAALAIVAAGRGPSGAAATLHGAAQAELETAGVTLEPVDAEPFREVETALRASLGAKEFDAATARGRLLGGAEQQRLVARVLDQSRPPDSPLTRRELEVVRLVAAGLTNGEIAERLVLSDHTVHRHVANILRKLDVRSRAAAASHAAQTGLL